MTEVDDLTAQLIASIVPVDLKDQEIVITDSTEKLWRQVHKNNLIKNLVSAEAFREEIVKSDAFVGTNEARYEISTCMASHVDAEQAHKHFIRTHSSEGSYEVSVKHVEDGFGRAIDDSKLQVGDDPVIGHAYIDLRGMHRTIQRRARSILADAATKNGRIYPPV